MELTFDDVTMLILGLVFVAAFPALIERLILFLPSLFSRLSRKKGD